MDVNRHAIPASTRRMRCMDHDPHRRGSCVRARHGCTSFRVPRGGPWVRECADGSRACIAILIGEIAMSMTSLRAGGGAARDTSASTTRPRHAARYASRHARDQPHLRRSARRRPALIRHPDSDRTFPPIATLAASRGVARAIPATSSAGATGHAVRAFDPRRCTTWRGFFPPAWSRSPGARSGKTNGRSRHGTHRGPEAHHPGG